MKCLLVDHSDSFSHNVMHFLQLEPYAFEVTLCNFKNLQDVKIESFDLLVLGPGPFSPNEVPESVELVKAHLLNVPILGFCLGMQVLNVATGGKVERSISVHHGSAKMIRWCGSASDMGSSKVGSYNSLTNIEISEDWEIIARDTSGEIQAVVHRSESVQALGLQFHPESFLSAEPMKIKKFTMEKLMAGKVW